MLISDIPVNLNYALECLWKCGAPLKVTLPIIDVSLRLIIADCCRANCQMQDLEIARPKVHKIWAGIGEARQEREVLFDTAILFGKEARQQIIQGTLTLDSRAAPQIKSGG